MKKSVSNPLSLAAASILGQAPRRKGAGLAGYFKPLQ